MPTTHNALAVRMIQKITPPVLTSVKSLTVLSFFSFTLLHRASAPCGRAFCVLLLGAMLLAGAACSGDAPQSTREMELLYAESSGLSHVPADSIQRFATKVETYARQTPTAQTDPLWTEIIENIQSAAHGTNITFHITINTAWDGEIIINF